MVSQTWPWDWWRDKDSSIAEGPPHARLPDFAWEYKNGLSKSPGGTSGRYRTRREAEDDLMRVLLARKVLVAG